jgi:hypothetical protein
MPDEEASQSGGPVAVKVGCQSAEDTRVVTNETQYRVAFTAQPTSEMPVLMAMVKTDAPFSGGPAAYFAMGGLRPAGYRFLLIKISGLHYSGLPSFALLVGERLQYRRLARPFFVMLVSAFTQDRVFSPFRLQIAHILSAFWLGVAAAPACIRLLLVFIWHQPSVLCLGSLVRNGSGVSSTAAVPVLTREA